MTTSSKRRIAIGSAVELLAWSIPVACFLAIYISQFSAGADVVAPHLKSLLPFWLLFAGIRLAVGSVFPEGAGRDWAGTVAIVLPWVMLLAWYLLVLTGLGAWGRVITWPIMKTYAMQSGHLLEVLGISPTLALLMLLTAVFAPILICRRFLVGSDWASALTRNHSRATSLFASVGIVAISTTLFYTSFVVSRPHPQEPIALSFFDQHKQYRQSHATGRSRILDLREDEARSAYTPNATQSTARNLIVIVGDALRSEHMSTFGYERKTTPNIDQLVESRSSITAKNARAVCAESMCGLLAIATSRPIHQTPSRPFTLFDALRRNGYEAHLILGGDHANFYGLKELYGDVDSYFDGGQQKLRFMNDDELIIDRLEAFPAAMPGKPIAIQFHLMSTHGLGTRHAEFSAYEPAENYYRWSSKVGNEPIRAPSSQQTSAAVNFYDNGVSQFDGMTARILGALERKGYLDNALVVITGDHGEMLGERGMFGHQHFVFESLLRVPFILLRYGYGSGSTELDALTSQIDIAPTVMRELGLSVPSTWEGHALQDPPENRFLHFQQSGQVGLYDANRTDGRSIKYWRNTLSIEEFVFDIVTDSNELNNLVDHTSSTELRAWRTETFPASLMEQSSD